MREQKVLKELYSGAITAQEAYSTLYPSVDKKQLKRARFVKMKIKTNEGGRAGRILLNVLFFLPLPMVFVRLISRIAYKSGAAKGMMNHASEIKEDFSFQDLNFLLKYCRGAKLTVDSEDANISIKIY